MEPECRMITFPEKLKFPRNYATLYVNEMQLRIALKKNSISVPG
jgi:hypothetical protein